METKQLRFLGLYMAVLLFFVHFATYAQVNMSATGSYSQDFNSLSRTGSSNNFTNNSTISSWYIEQASGTANSYAAGDGSSNSGGFYSFGATSGGSRNERALGQLNTNTIGSTAVGLLLKNTSGKTIEDITVGYTLEQWRKAGDDVQGIAFSYQTSSSNITDLTPNSNTCWTSVSGLNLNGPVSTGSDNNSLNGNSSGNRVSASNVSLSGLSLANGDYIMLRWVDVNHTGNDHGLAVDDVAVNYTVPISFIYSNDITTNSNSANPFTTNQVVDVNATATGIGRGSGLTYSSENGAYAATSWGSGFSIDVDDYFEFSVSPAVGYQLNFDSFDYQGQRRNSNAPFTFDFRSSLDYNTSIGSTFTATNTNSHDRSIDLSAGTYQNIQSPITFRLYGYFFSGATGEFSINNFAFLGTVTMIPPTVSNTTPTVICDNSSGQVTISGNNLIHVTTVTVGGTAVTIDSKTNTQIVVTVPQGVSGLVTITNAVGSANGATITLLNAVTYYADVDGDGFGDAANSVSNCTGQPVGYVTNSLDCNDDLLLYEDLDEDGFGSLILVPCEGVTNNLDTNDNLVTYVDADADGYGSSVFAVDGVTVGGDCNDANPAINPGATEICYDGIDQNCDGNTNDGCAVITATLRAENCGQSLTSLNQVVRGNSYSQAIPSGVTVTGYRFKVTNLITLQERIVDRSNYVFQLTYTDFAEYNTPYSVEVALRLNQEWMTVYGAACTITTPGVPNTVLAPTSCGATLVQMNNIIRAVVVPSALNYEYNVALIENGIPVATTTLVRSGESFNLLQLTGIPIKFGAEYSVTIRVEVPTSAGAQWSTVAGAACSVFTPLAQEAAIEGCGSETGITPATMSTLIRATAIGGATNYRFTLTDGLSYTQVYTTPNRYFSLNNFNALSPLTAGGSYSVFVEVEVYGNYYEGKDCNILVPGGSGRPIEPITRTTVGSDNAMGEFKAVAYPNPFATNFAINLRSNNTSEVSLAIYDMTGRLLETRNIKADVLSNQAIGDRYPAGVYNVIVNQGENTQTIRVVKQ